MVEQGLEDLPAPPKKRGISPEWKLQIACVKRIRAQMRVDKSLRFIAAMPEGQRSAARAGISKAMGLEAGVADIILLRKKPGLRIDWVELKVPERRNTKRGGLSEEQEAWQLWFHGTPVHCWTCYSVEEFTKILDL